MASEADPFLWPAFFYGDTVKPPPAAFYELFEEAWKRDTWDLQELGVPCRNVLEDSAPILLQSRVMRTDCMKAYRNRKYLYDEWTEKVPVWHLHWINESRLLWFWGSEDRGRLIEWLLKGMDSLWFNIAMQMSSSVISIRFMEYFSPLNTATNTIEGSFLQRISKHLSQLGSLDGRFAEATGKTGLQPFSTTGLTLSARNLLCFSGRLKNDNFLIWLRKPFREVKDALNEALEVPGAPTLPLSGVEKEAISGTPQSCLPPPQDIFDY